jgi:hypothetical protein
VALDSSPLDSSRAVGEVGLGGTAVCLAAAAMWGTRARCECFNHKKHHNSINKTHLFVILLAFPAAQSLSKAMGVVGLGLAAVWLTAAPVPSQELSDSNARRSVEGVVMATEALAAQMVRAQPAVG